MTIGNTAFVRRVVSLRRAADNTPKAKYLEVRGLDQNEAPSHMARPPSPWDILGLFADDDGDFEAAIAEVLAERTTRWEPRYDEDDA